MNLWLLLLLSDCLFIRNNLYTRTQTRTHSHNHNHKHRTIEWKLKNWKPNRASPSFKYDWDPSSLIGVVGNVLWPRVWPKVAREREREIDCLCVSVHITQNEWNSNSLTERKRARRSKTERARELMIVQSSQLVSIGNRQCRCRHNVWCCLLPYLIFFFFCLLLTAETATWHCLSGLDSGQHKGPTATILKYMDKLMILTVCVNV